MSSRPPAIPASARAADREKDFKMIKDLGVLENYDVLSKFDALSELPKLLRRRRRRRIRHSQDEEPIT